MASAQARQHRTHAMFKPKIASLAFVAATSVLSTQAWADSSGFRSFRSIELGADPAAMIDDVRADLSTRLPAGTSIAEARALLRGAGAHCRAPKANGMVRCRYNDIHIEDDIIQDVSWTVDIQTSGDSVTSFTVARDPALD